MLRTPPPDESERSVGGRRADLELLDAVHQRSEFPFAGAGVDRRAVQVELVAAGGAAVHGQAAVGVPRARAAEAAGAELLLREDHAGGELRQHEDLPAVQRQFADALVVHELADHRAIGVDGREFGGDGDVLGLRADVIGMLMVERSPTCKVDAAAGEFLEARPRRR